MRRAGRRTALLIVLTLAGEAAFLAAAYVLKRSGFLQIKNLLSRTFLAFLMLDALLAYAFVCGRRRGSEAFRKKRAVAAAVFLFALIASLPLFVDYLPFVPNQDHMFHLIRIEGIADGLKSGEFPVRLHPETLSGYGYAAPIFYPEPLLYLPALLRVLGFSVQAAYKCFVFAVNLLTAIIAYVSFKRAFGSARAGLIGSFLYTLALYRLTCTYTRASVGEYTAIAFLPLLVWGACALLAPEPDGRTHGAVMPLALGMSGLILTHTLTAALAFVLLTAVCLLFADRFFRRPSRFLSVLYAALLTTALTAFYAVPMLWETFSVRTSVFTSELVTSFVHAISPYQLFPLFPAAGGSSEWYDSGVPGEMPLGLGFAALAVLAGWAILRFRNDGNGSRRFGNTVWWILAALCLMTTRLFPWEAIYRSGGFGSQAVTVLEFPWRLRSVASVLHVTLALCLLRDAERLPARWVGPAVCALVCLLTLMTSQGYMDRLMREAAVLRPMEAGDLDRSWGIMNGEFLPSEATREKADYDGKIIVSDPAVSIEETVRAGNRTRLVLRNGSAAEQSVTLPRVWYPGYEASADGTRLACGQGEKGFVRVRIPSGFSGAVVIRFVSPFLWTAALVLSALTAAALCAEGVRRTVRSATRKTKTP